MRILRFLCTLGRVLRKNPETVVLLQSTQENNKQVICLPRSVRIGKNCALSLGYSPRPAASGYTQDLWHSLSQYGPPGRQIIYILPKLTLLLVLVLRQQLNLLELHTGIYYCAIGRAEAGLEAEEEIVQETDLVPPEWKKLHLPLQLLTR